MFAGVRQFFALWRMPMQRRALLCLLICPILAVRAAEPAPLIAISGVSDPLQENIRAHLRISTESCTISLLRLERLKPRVEQNITLALNALGYYHSSSILNFSAGEDCWKLDIAVTPSEPVYLRTLDITVQGPAQSLFIPIIEESALKTGAILNHGFYESLKNDLSSLAADNGYFDARFDEALIKLDLPAKKADVILHFNPGERYRFGPISIERNGVLSTELISNMLFIQPDEPYSASNLAEVRDRLDNSGFFNQIRVSPQMGANVDYAVPITIELGLRPRHAWTGGLGFTTDTGPRARMSYENRYINSRGHSIGVDATVSAVRSLLNGKYSIPLINPYADRVVFNTGYIIEKTDAFDSTRLQTGISLPKELDSGWQRSLTLDLQRDNYLVGEQKDVSVLLLPGISFNKSAADDLINPTSGWKLYTSLRGASSSLFSDNDLVQLYASAKHIVSVGSMRLLSRVEAGSTWIDATAQLPASLRYFAGGDQSVRGFDFRALGPLDETSGAVVGGKHLAVASAEADFPIRQNWRVAFFTDAGNAFNDTANIKVRTSAGVGIRWLSPIGPFRIDLAHPFNADESFRLHITMGPDL